MRPCRSATTRSGSRSTAWPKTSPRRDETGRPVKVPQLIAESAIEKERFEGALRRKQLSLVLAGKMKPSEATELKAIFEKIEVTTSKIELVTDEETKVTTLKSETTISMSPETYNKLKKKNKINTK